MHSVGVKVKYSLLVLCSLFLFVTTYAGASAETAGNQNVTFVEVEGEYYHFLALDDKGNVWGWGSSDSGQLGEDSGNYQSVPKRIKGFENAAQIAAGYDHSTVLKQDGTVWVMGGGNHSGSEPRQVTGISDIVALADSAFYTLALRKDGTVWGWGRNDAGQLGIGKISEHEETPVQVQPLSDVTSISASFEEGMASTSDGKVWRWGGVIQCTGITCKKEIVTSPIPFEGLSNVQEISNGIAIVRDGTVVTWGINFQGSLGDGSMEYGYAPDPIPLLSLTDIVKVSKTRALTRDGHVWSWGRNEYGQVGDGTTDAHSKPIILSTIDHVTDIASGEEITVALTRDGKLHQWGDNRMGQISSGSASIMPPTPVQMTRPIVTYALPVPWQPEDWSYGWTFLDANGSIVKDNQRYYKVKPFSEGLAAVYRVWDELWSFIDVHGEPAFPGSFRLAKDFHQGMAAVKDKNGWNFVNKNGEFINKDRYRNADSFANGLAPVLVNKKWGYIDLSGRMAIAPQFTSAQSFASGLAAVKAGSKWGFIDTTGKFVIKAVYSAVGTYTGQVAAVNQNGKWGYVNKKGASVIKPQYEDAKAFGDTKLAPVKIKGKWGYINLSGKMVIPAVYEDAATFQEGLASVKKNGLWAIIDGSGKAVTAFQFVEVQPYNNKLAWVVTSEDNGYLNAAGKWYYKDKIIRFP